MMTCIATPKPPGFLRSGKWLARGFRFLRGTGEACILGARSGLRHRAADRGAWRDDGRRDVVGIDPAQPMLDIARARAGGHSVTWGPWRRARRTARPAVSI